MVLLGAAPAVPVCASTAMRAVERSASRRVSTFHMRALREPGRTVQASGLDIATGVHPTSTMCRCEDGLVRTGSDLSKASGLTGHAPLSGINDLSKALCDRRHRGPKTRLTASGSVMWTPTTRQRYSREGLRYETDVTDAEWLLIEALLPKPPGGGRPTGVVLA